MTPGLRAVKRGAGVWQRRYWEFAPVRSQTGKRSGGPFEARTGGAPIRDEADFLAHVEYCWGNPVKHGLVERAADWPYSSIHRDIRLGRVSPEWAGAVAEGAFGT